MKHHVEITICAEVPADHEDLGHEAIVATKEAAAAMVQALEKLGLKHVRQVRRIKRGKEAAAPAGKTAAAAE